MCVFKLGVCLPFASMYLVSYTWIFADMCVCSPLSLLIISSVIWIPYDWLNRFYSFYVAAVVGIVSRRGLSIDACHEKQPSKYKLALYKQSIHFNCSLKQLYISRRWRPPVIKVVVAWCVSRHLKITLSKFCICCYVVLSKIF